MESPGPGTTLEINNIFLSLLIQLFLRECVDLLNRFWLYTYVYMYLYLTRIRQPVEEEEVEVHPRPNHFEEGEFISLHPPHQEEHQVRVCVGARQGVSVKACVCVRGMGMGFGRSVSVDVPLYA